MGNQLKVAYQTQRGPLGERAVTGVRDFKSVTFATRGFCSPCAVEAAQEGGLRSTGDRTTAMSYDATLRKHSRTDARCARAIFQLL